MRRAQNRDYGQKIDYDPQWKGPLEIERKPTDFGFLIALIVYFAVWISVGIYAFCTGDVESMSNDVHLYYHSSDFSIVMYISLGFTIFGTFLSFTYLFLLRYLTKTVFFGSIFLILVFLLAMCGVIMHILNNRRNSGNTKETGRLFITLNVTLVVCIVVFIGLVACLVLCRRKLLIACEVIKESTKAVMFFPASFLFPILPFTLCLVVLAFSACTALFLYENPAMKNGNNIYLDVLHAINFFGLLWMLGFISAFSQMVLSGTFATWYWIKDKSQIPSRTILKFMHITTRFHLGSLAFGSLILAIVETIKALLRQSAQRSAERGDDLSTVLFGCSEAICGITKNFLEYVNNNAYIMCTIHGTRFIQSAKDAFNLLMRNITNVIVITSVTPAIFFSGGLLVLSFSVLATYGYCRNMEDDVKYSAMFIVLLSTALMLGGIFDILQTSIRTIFLCVLEDYERNNGSRERPYFMSDELKQLFMPDG